ncbi:MAG TPA: hypothetical protein VIX19_17060 [Terriglobales bacterium]
MPNIFEIPTHNNLGFAAITVARPPHPTGELLPISSAARPGQTPKVAARARGLPVLLVSALPAHGGFSPVFDALSLE